MYFPIADVTVNPFFLAGVGFLVGLLGGFFGVGGGFLAGPMMFLVGVPMNFVVGTDLAHMTGKSIVAARRHRALGHVDIKLGLLMVLGTIPGIEVGARIVEGLEASGTIDLVVGVAYIVILLAIGVFTAWESLHAMQLIRDRADGRQGRTGLSGSDPPRPSFQAATAHLSARLWHRVDLSVGCGGCRVFSPDCWPVCWALVAGSSACR